MSASNGFSATVDYWHQNRRVLSKGFDLAHILPAGDSARAAILPTPSGAPTVQTAAEKGLVFVHSSRDPQAEARQWVDHVDQEDWQIGILLGFGLGYHVEELIQRYPERTLIVLEPDPALFAAALHARDLRAVLTHPNLYLNISSDVDISARFVFEHLRNNLREGKPALLAWPLHQRQWGDFWHNVQRAAVEYSNQDLVNMATYRSLSYKWLENFFTNFRTSARDPGFASLEGVFAGKPAFLVSAGPSLDKNAHLLAQAKGKAVIIAVLQAVRALREHGVEPDLVVSFDPKEINYTRHFAGIETDNLALVYVPILYPRIVQEFRGPRFVVGADIYPFSLWLFDTIGEPKGMALSGPSVANLTWDLIRQLGCDPVVFVGQDLAFTGEKTHADNVTGGGQISSELMEEIRKNPDKYSFVEGWNGEKILTNRSMLAMKLWFEQKIASLPGRRFINATEGGANIRGTEMLTLEETIQQVCHETFLPDREIRALHAIEAERLASSDLEAKVRDALQSVRHGLTEVQRIGQRAAKPLRTLVSLVDDGELTEAKFNKLYRRIRHLDRALHQVEASRYCVTPVIHHQIAAVNIVASQFLKERDLIARGKLLTEIYLPLFHVASEAAAQLSLYVDRALTDADD